MSPADARDNPGSGREAGPLLAVDVGNHLTKAARFDAAHPAADVVFPTADAGTPADLTRLTGGLGRCDAVALCSVVPRATDTWVEFARTTLAVEPFVIRGDTPTPLINRYRTPLTLGADRLAAAVAAQAVAGAPVIVVMMGTATTVNAVSAQGEFLGGAIAPGVHAGLKGLVTEAAQLADVDLTRPDRAIGRTSDEAMQAGVVFGAVGQVRELVARVRREFPARPGGADVPIVLTGGDAGLVARDLDGVHSTDHALVLRGVYLIWRHNLR